MVQSLIRQNSSINSAAVQKAINAAISNLTPQSIGAEPVGEITKAIANLNLTPAGIGAEPAGSIQAAIAKIKPPHRKIVHTQWQQKKVLILRQWSDHYNWEPSGHRIDITSYFYDINQIDFSSHFCSYSRGAVKVTTKINGRYKPEWSEAVAVPDVYYANRQLYYRELSVNIPQWQMLLISTTTPLHIVEDINSNTPRVVYLYP